MPSDWPGSWVSRFRQWRGNRRHSCRPWPQIYCFLSVRLTTTSRSPTRIVTASGANPWPRSRPQHRRRAANRVRKGMPVPATRCQDAHHHSEQSTVDHGRVDREHQMIDYGQLCDDLVEANDALLASVGRDRELNRAFIKRLVICVHQLNQDLVRSRGQAVDDQRLATRVGPAPRRVVDRYMDVPDPRRHHWCVWAEHRHDVQIFAVVTG